MKKTSGTEAIRRGFNILATVSRSPMSSIENRIFSEYLKDYGNGDPSSSDDA